MDGEKNGKPYEQMDDLGETPLFFGSAPISGQIIIFHHLEPLGLIFEHTRKDSGQFII